VGVARSVLVQTLESVADLVRYERWEGLLTAFRQALNLTVTRADGVVVAQAMNRVPMERRALPEWRRLAARVAYRSGDVTSGEALLDAVGDAPGLEAFRAWVHLERGRYEAALHSADAALEDVDVALRVRPYAVAMLRRADWAEVFEASLAKLEGRQRGLTLMSYGAFLSYHGRDAEARSAYAESLALLREDVFFVAQVEYNLAVACLRLDLPDQALTHALRATRSAASLDGSRFRGRAWSGLGAVQRAREEWPRALQSYENAVRLASDGDDRVQAWRGLAMQQRIARQVPEALTTLYEVVHFDPGFTRVHADLAAAKLQNGDAHGALQTLEHLGDTSYTEENARVLVVRAELERRAGKAARALEYLYSPLLTPAVRRDERWCFPELFALVGEDCARLPPMRVRVSMDGAVRVFINELELSPALRQRESSLVACLVEARGQLSAERLIDALELPGRNERLRSQTLHRVAKSLRDALGWDASVTVERSKRVYRLDKNIVWQSTYPEPERSDAFCDGLHDRWVEEWRHARL
jgi:tetratricopeptide (TPR) repeat protein